IIYFHENTIGKLMLHSEAVLHGVGIFEIRVYRAHAKDSRSSPSTTGNVRQIATVELHRLQKGHYASLPKDDVALGFVVENTEASANNGLGIAEGREGKTETRREQVFTSIEAARTSRRHGLHKSAVSARNAHQLVCRYVARTHQSINYKSLVEEGTTGSRNIETIICAGKQGYAWLIQGWIEVGDVIALKVGWPMLRLPRTGSRVKFRVDFQVVVIVGLVVV